MISRLRSGLKSLALVCIAILSFLLLGDVVGCASESVDKPGHQPSSSRQSLAMSDSSAQGSAGTSTSADAGGGTSSGSALSPKLPDGRQRAFPTAEGFGAAAKGGRGGKVVYVTNLNDRGEGSLRACVDASGARTCIFRVAGTITTETPFKITEPFLTIAGESAPGGGIAIRNGPGNGEAPLQTLTHDVIVRHIRLRPGPGAKSCCLNALAIFRGTRDVMFDHLSLSWGVDQNVTVWKYATDYTIQWSIISEPLYDAPHQNHQGRRARNINLTHTGNNTFHHNLLAHTTYRDPLVENDTGVTDIVNNVIYDSGRADIGLSDRYGRLRANVVGNFDIDGPVTLQYRARHARDLLADNYLVMLIQEGKVKNGFEVFVDANYSEPHLTSAAQPAIDAVYPGYFGRKSLVADAAWRARALVSSRVPAPAVRTGSPQEAYASVLAGAGATRPRRDAVDTRIVSETKNRTGQLVLSDPAEVGGWPDLSGGAPYADADRDGIADAWETAHGLDPDNPADGAEDRDGDGWTNLEEFLHELAGD
jgi:pectate lyase